MQGEKMMHQDGGAGEESGNKHQSPGRGRPRGETAQPIGRGRSPRSACNFCHDKRVKCVMMEGDTRCEQCTQRDMECIFSIKGKTGPKPKNVKSELPRPKGSKTTRRRRISSPTDPCPPPKRPAATDSDNVDVGAGPAAAGAVNTATANGAAAAANAAAANAASAAAHECVLLDIYIGSIGKLVPLVDDAVLRSALKERHRAPRSMVEAVDASEIACLQAQVMGAISLGALINGDLQAAEAYHDAVGHHLGDVQRIAVAYAAPSIVLLALYWQHRGEDGLKAELVMHVRRVLGHVDVSTDLVLCIEHLDYAREAHVRPGIDELQPSRRALHIISCLLSNMPVVVNSAVGRATAVAYCDDLGVCVHGLRTKSSMELSLLLCQSLRALLLVMLGHRDAAVAILTDIPPLVEAPSGGNPAVARALPLSWDALLIAAALSFLLGQGQTYRRLRMSIDLATKVPLDACWTFCLPDPGSNPRDYLIHGCDSNSNICTIMCEIASKTDFGLRPFYPDEQSLLRPPVVALSPDHKHEGYPQGVHRYGYGVGGMAMRRRPSEQWGEDGGRAGDTVVGRRLIDVGESEGAAAETHADWRASSGSSESRGTSKRRKMLPVDSGDASEATDNIVSEAGQRSPMPPLNDDDALAGGAAAANFRESTPHHGDYAVFASGERRVHGGEGEPEEEDGMGLTRGLHNMSLSRLSVALPGGGVASTGFHEDQGPLGRVPSEGIMDLGSTIGSFSIDPSGGGEVGGHHGGECDGAFVGEAAAWGRRQPRTVSSFSTFSSALCRSGSSVILRDQRSSNGCRSRGESFGQGSDLGHDIVGVATDGFMDEEGNDMCGNLLSVDAILGNLDDITGGNTAENARKGGPGAGGGGSNSSGNRQSGGSGAVASVHEQQSSVSGAIAAVRASTASHPRVTSPATVGAKFMASAGRKDGRLPEKAAIKPKREIVMTVSTPMQLSRQGPRELWVREEHR